MRSQKRRKRREDSKIKLSNAVRISTMVLSIIIIAIGSGNFIKDLNAKKEYVTESEELYKYDNKYFCDAKINLKENAYVQEKDMVEGQTYLSDLISNIDMNIKYNYTSSVQSEIKYSYKVEAIMKATYTNTKSSYDVLNKVDVIKEKSEKTDATKQFSIDDKISVDYEKYHKLMKEFKQAMGISTDSQLYIRFTIDTSANVNSKPIDNQYVANYKISIGDKVAVISPIENEKTSKSIKNEGQVREEYEIDYNLAVIHLSVVIIGIVILVFIIRRTKELKTIRNEYKLELNRILKSYEDKIVEIQDLNNIDISKATRVKDIIQLRKLAEEALVPIYSYIKEEEAYFIVTKYENSYIYILK